MKRFVHLQCHSSYSFFEGVPHVSEIVERAKELEMTSVAITDTNGLYGAVVFQKEARLAGIKPIFGSCIRWNGREATLLAKNVDGFEELSQLITRLRLHEGFSLETECRNISDNLIFISGDGFLLRTVVGVGRRSNVYAGLQLTEDIDFRRRLSSLCSICSECKIQLVIVNNVHFLMPDQYEVYRVLRGIDINTTICSIPEKGLVSRESYFKSSEQMWNCGGGFREALASTCRIAEKCNVSLDLGKLMLPGFSVDERAVADEFAKHGCRRDFVITDG